MVPDLYPGFRVPGVPDLVGVQPDSTTKENQIRILHSKTLESRSDLLKFALTI